MKHGRFTAMSTMAAMLAGSMATAMPVMAESKTTTVSLTVEKPANTYTLSVPANTTLNSDGTATELTNGITITDGNLEDGKKLTVTASSGNNWKIKADGVSTGIGYTLYSDAGTTKATSWEFSQAEANAANGTTKSVYAGIVADDAKNASAGTYSDTITFSAQLKETTISFYLHDVKYSVTEGTTWKEFAESSPDLVYINTSSRAMCKTCDRDVHTYGKDDSYVATDKIKSGSRYE